MSRDEQEMIMWLSEYVRSTMRDAANRAAEADCAVEQFRKRYPVEPAAPEAVWYDEPPFPGEYHVVGLPRACWVDQDIVYYPEWDRDGERPRIREMSRAGRRVCPITKPPEPTQ